MPWALISLLLLVLGPGTSPEKIPAKPAASRNAAASIASEFAPSPSYDLPAEEQLLEMANQSRRQAGLSLLQADSNLTLAARAHADAMAEQQQLSHQLPGEPSLSSRLAVAGSLHLDRAGENVAVDVSAEEAHAHLMLSPPHRENLLDPGYNVAGFGVVRSGNRIYVVEDFGHSLPVYSGSDSEQLILNGLDQLRHEANLPNLVRAEQPGLRDAVCAMALEGRLATRPMHDFAQHFAVLSYTNLHPEILPASASHLVADRRITNVSVSACYARTNSYPNGAYWVGVLLY
jgi:uncharacterized protein YkwD